MFRVLCSVIFFSISAASFSQKRLFLNDIYSYIESPAVYELNQEEGHTPLVPYMSVNEALDDNRNKASWRISLNGTWKFHYAEKPEGTPDGFFAENFNDKKWSNIHVPSNWEMQGFGDPLFRNIATPFRPDPPNVPRECNPTGSYRRTFNIPSTWKNREVFLRMEKTASASFVWINGRELGYNEGAQEPAEYNITEYIKPGRNTIAVLVIKYSDGYYLEDQDYWRLAGIFDDVWLFAAPKTHIFDWHAVTDLDDSYTDARFDLSVDLKNYSEYLAEDMILNAVLHDSDKKIVKKMVSEKVSLLPDSKQNVRMKAEIIKPVKWSAENPYLYSLTLELMNSKGQTVEVIKGRIGFKETEIRNQVFYLNGVAVKLNGINSHMQHPELGHTMDEATIRKDMAIFKQFNINCVRTSHYPPVSRYLELADEYGIYIVDETGDEAHATEYLSRNKEWEGMYRDRARKMVLRDRNYPSILFWSAGNESGEGDNICAVISEGKKYDRTRYWMYGGNAFAHKCEDIIGPRYPQLFSLINNVFLVPDSVDPRPSFLDEYLAVTGNGGGGLDDYWDSFYSHPRSMGGAIWDFVSTGITEKIKSLKDESDNNVKVNVMGRARLSDGISGQGIDLNGHDQWVEIYRDDALETEGNQLTLALWVFPRALNSSAGTLINKGNYQYGIRQVRNDSLEFYITTRSRQRVQIALPDRWENNWHFISAVYDGKSIHIEVDGRKGDSKALSGNILNTPFPVNIGRNAELHGQETRVYLCDAVIDQVSVFTKVVSSEDLRNPGPQLKKEAALWLDFEEISEDGEFFSYGIGARTYGSIWPDRRPQPEMWQIKKSGQPVSVKLLSAEKGEVEITNRHLFTGLSSLVTVWMVEADNAIIEQGEISADVPAQRSAKILIPYHKPALKEGVEYRLLLSFRLKENMMWAEKGYEIAWEQMELPWRLEPQSRVPASVNSLTIKDENDNLIVSGNGFRYVFSRSPGSITSLQLSGKEMLKRGAKMNVWRAPLANETDEWSFRWANNKHRTEGYGRFAATEWYSSGLDKMEIRNESFEYKIIDDQTVIIDISNMVILGTDRGAFFNRYRYTVSGSGLISLDHTIIPNGNMPAWLPRIGMQWVMDKSIRNVEWYGRGPQENYPDRKSGYRTGVYKSTVDEMYEPYLIPQDYGLRTDNRWVRMTGDDGTGLEFSGDDLFNFSAHQWSEENLTRALYTYQLQPSDEVTFNFDYATSGVGCTALSVFPEYQVIPQRFDFSVTIKPLMR